LLSSRGISTPSLQARGEQRRFFYFNNDRDIPRKRNNSKLHLEPLLMAISDYAVRLTKSVLNRHPPIIGFLG
jgi:hypothetical protein